MTKTNVQSPPSNSQHHDTPNNKTHVIKFRVTAEEKTSLELTCKLLNLSMSTLIRRALHNAKIERTVVVAGGGEETLTTVSTLLAQCSKAQFKQDTIGKLIDIQSRMTEGKGIGYKRWLTKHNLKVMAHTVNLLQEKGLTDEDALNQRIAELETKYHDSLAVVKDLEGRMKANKELRYHVTAYANTKSVAQQLKTAKRPAAFEEQHCAELTACRAAAAYFKANDITKLPSPKKLEAEYNTMASEKAKFYEQYKEAKSELLKLQTAKQNVASYFREEEQTQQER